MNEIKKGNIKIHRTRQNIAKFRPYSIFMDGEKVKEIKDNETTIIPTMPGTHIIQAKVDLKRSNVIELQTHLDQTTFLQIGRKDISKLQKVLSLFVWAFCIAIGAIISPAYGAGIGFCVGYILKSQITNKIWIFENLKENNLSS